MSFNGSQGTDGQLAYENETFAQQLMHNPLSMTPAGNNSFILWLTVLTTASVVISVAQGKPILKSLGL